MSPFAFYFLPHFPQASFLPSCPSVLDCLLPIGKFGSRAYDKSNSTEPLTLEQQRVAFLLEAEAELLRAQALTEDGDTIGSARGLPPYITNYIGSKQKLTDWIWAQTPDGVGSMLDAFSGSAVVGYMFKTKGLRVVANDRLSYCFHAARAIITLRFLAQTRKPQDPTI